jgi:hypothetical protein
MRLVPNTLASSALAVCMIIALRNVQAGSIVTGDDRMTRFPTAAAANLGTTDLRVHTREFNMTNQSVFSFLKSGGVNINNPPNGVLLPNIQNISVRGANGAITRYVPVYGLEGQPKNKVNVAGDFQDQESRTDVYGAFAQQEFDTARRLRAGGRLDFNAVGPPPPGAAAGGAYDPVTVTGGSSYAYGPTIDVTFQLGNPGVSAGLDIYAVDSTVTDSVSDFLNEGSPFQQTLWVLSLDADQPLNSTSDVSVDFELNPLALQEIVLPTSYLLTLPGYSAGLSNAELADLIDAAFESSIAAALAFTNGTVSLQDFQLFPDGTQFQPIGDVTYAEGVSAGLNAVPEPTALWILATSVLCLFGFCCSQILLFSFSARHGAVIGQPESRTNQSSCTHPPIRLHHW